MQIKLKAMQKDNDCSKGIRVYSFLFDLTYCAQYCYPFITETEFSAKGKYQ